MQKLKLTEEQKKTKKIDSTSKSSNDQSKMYKITGIFLAIFLLASIGFVVYQEFNDKEVDDNYNLIIEDAEMYYKVKDYSEALKKYTEATEKYKSGYEGYAGIVTILLDKNLLTEAKEVMKSASDRLDGSETAKLYHQLASHYLRKEEWSDAKENYEKSYNLKSTPEASIGYIKSSYKLGDLGIDNKYWDSAGEAEGTVLNLEVVLLKSISKFEDGNLSDISSVVNKGTDFANNIGDSASDYELSLLQWHNSMINTLDIASEDKENKIYVNTLLAREAVNAGYPVFARNLLEEYVGKMNNYWDGLYILGRGYYGVGNYDKALEFFEKAVTAGSDKPEIYLYIARTYYKRNDLNKTIEYYERSVAFADYEEDKEIYKEYVDVLYEEKYYNNILTFLDELSETENDPWIDIAYAEAEYKLTSDWGEAYKYIEEIDPENINEDELLDKYYYYLAMYLIKSKKMAEAETIFEEYEKVDEDGATYNYLYGRYFIEVNEPDKAREYFEDAIEYDLDGEVTVLAKESLVELSK